ncbi:MAG: UvrD-helicase domain-containing protein [Bacteroidales bacterium]|nr:UvrD-helicase domain-containing protein [Bacteroidales bacterium]
MVAFGIIVLICLFLALVIFKKTSTKVAEIKLVSLQNTLDELRDTVDTALADISAKFTFSHYITESERKEIDEKYSQLLKRLRLFVERKQMEECKGTEPFKRLYKGLSDTSGFKAINNDKFIKEQLNKHSQYFDTVLAYPLDPQQREAIVSLEDNVLVISSAGSGKTMTTVGKVRYLIDKQNVDPKKILLITFTRKAAASLSERLGEKSLKCVTFHKLALDVIAEATGEKPDIAGSDFPILVYHDLMDNNQEFHHAISDYVLRARYKMRDQFDYTSAEDYMKDRKTMGIQAYYTDMDGRPIFCKSDEESQICDYLGERGVKFRYEEKYEFNVQDQEHRQYKPDFSIYFEDCNGRDRHIYLEHFAVNEKGHVPAWFGDGTTESHQIAENNYLNGIEWKRKIHQEKGTVLLETRSADFHRGDVFEILDKQLKECGLEKYNYQKNKDVVSRELAKQEQSILDMLTAFTFLLKSKGMQPNSLDSLGIERKDKVTVNQIIKPYLLAYQKRSNDTREIDFVDAINMATDLCNNGHRHEYEYILVDEFQDISLDRYKFLQSLRTVTPLTKLFCVGDDWQSIYRFAGSDMALFKDFSKYFGYTKECRMETTYRFGEPLIQKTSEFILHNPDQKSKTVRPFNQDATTKLEFIGVADRDDTVSKVISLIDSLPKDKEIYVLGRYSFNVNVFKNSPISIKHTSAKTSLTYNGRDMTYMTVHQSKGLECDYVILLGCDSGNMGFPAEIADPPVLKYVLSAPDGYEYGEERRVFYVGITRAKIVTFVFFNTNRPSAFISEFISINNTNDSDEDHIPEDERCPKCKCGRVIEAYRGKAINGNPYAVYTCSNEKYGCDYKETIFVNLNRGYRERKR